MNHNNNMVLEVGHIEKGTGKHQSNVVYSENGSAPTICASYGVKQPPAMHVECVKYGNAANSNQRCAVYDEKGLSPTIQAAAGTGGNQQPMWVEVKQATKQGCIPCEIGGGGRFELSRQHNTQRKSARERSDMPNTNNGEYP